MGKSVRKRREKVEEINRNGNMWSDCGELIKKR
jgi:hypothetical protein